MRHFIFLVFACVLLFLSSCQKEEIVATNSPVQSVLFSKARTTPLLHFNIKQTNGTDVEKSGTSFSATHNSSNGFTVIIDPNTEYQQSFTATELEVIQSDNALDFIKNPNTQSQCIYEDKYKGLITINDQNSLSISINDGAIITTASNLITEEIGGL